MVRLVGLRGDRMRQSLLELTRGGGDVVAGNERIGIGRSAKDRKSGLQCRGHTERRNNIKQAHNVLSTGGVSRIHPSVPDGGSSGRGAPPWGFVRGSAGH